MLFLGLQIGDEYSRLANFDDYYFEMFFSDVTLAENLTIKFLIIIKFFND